MCSEPRVLHGRIKRNIFSPYLDCVTELGFLNFKFFFARNRVTGLSVTSQTFHLPSLYEREHARKVIDVHPSTLALVSERKRQLQVAFFRRRTRRTLAQLRNNRGVGVETAVDN